jgi:hypothetical protein
MIMSVGIMLYQIRAAQSVLGCGPDLPILWGAIAVSYVLLMLDAIPEWKYVIYFGAFFIVMAISSSIVWRKSKKSAHHL